MIRWSGHKYLNDRSMTDTKRDIRKLRKMEYITRGVVWDVGTGFILFFQIGCFWS